MEALLAAERAEVAKRAQEEEARKDASAKMPACGINGMLTWITKIKETTTGKVFKAKNSGNISASKIYKYHANLVKVGFVAKAKRAKADDFFRDRAGDIHAYLRAYWSAFKP